MKSIIVLLLIAAPLCAQRYNGTSRWTWPGDLSRHLQAHGFTAGELRTMNRSDRQRVHDRIHKRVRRGWPKKSDVNLVRSRAKYWTCPNCGRMHRR